MPEGDLGEFDLIERLGALLGPPADPRLVAGIGDDAAAWVAMPGLALATTDTMVAGVHFLPGTIPWRAVGWKALAANISDIAAMGGAPSFALVTLALPDDSELEELEELYRGMQEIADVYGVTVAGGDIVRSHELSITIALYGEATIAGGAPELLRRSAARPGDVIAVTGELGGSAGGLRALLDFLQALDDNPDAPEPEGPAFRALLEAHARPWPRVDAGQIALHHGIRCAIDISDGLAQDVGHICRASGVDARVELARLPLHEDLVTMFPDDAVRLAATGGEDYELVLVGAAAAIEAADAALRDHLDMPDHRQLIVIGEVTGKGDGRVRLVDARGGDVDFGAPGYDHLRGPLPE